jgi:glycosyltransferase involved in cell wall biosynthesis
MIKILFVVLGTNLNGTERYVVDIARNLPKNEFDIYIATPLKSNLSRFLKVYGIKEFVFNNGTVNSFSLNGLINLFKFIYKEKIDIVHSNSGILPCIITKIFFNKVCFETRHGIFFTKQQLENLPYGRKYFEYMKQYFVDSEIAISENDKYMLMKYFKIKEKNIKVIYNGINVKDFSKYRKENNCLNIDKIKLVNIGRLTFQKAQDVLLIAINLLKESLNNFCLTIIGDGEEKSNLLKYIKNNSLEDYVKIENYREDIFNYLKTFDVLVLSSRFEGIPYVMLEAMAIGLPVIVTDVGGISNVIKDGINGILVNEESPEEIKNAILSIANDKNKYYTIKENAFEDIKRYFLEAMVNDYKNLYVKSLKN